MQVEKISKPFILHVTFFVEDKVVGGKVFKSFELHSPTEHHNRN